MIRSFDSFINERDMYVDKNGNLHETIPNEIPQFIRDAYDRLKKKESGITWWIGNSYYKGARRDLFVIEYPLSATQTGQLLVYDIDNNKCEEVKTNSTDNELKSAAWEINHGTNQDRFEFYKEIRKGLQQNKVHK